MIALRNLQPPERLSTTLGEWLDVREVFYTIQGEGPLAGHPSIFVRLAGCNLQCPHCFGVSTKANIPYLHRSFGGKVRLDEVREGDEVLTFDQDFQLTETKVVRLLQRAVSAWLRLVIAGKEYDVTPEHPFFTTRGMVIAEELRVGDEVLEARPEEIIAHKKLGDRNPMKREEVKAKRVANTDYEELGRKVSATRLRKFASGELTPSFYTLTPEQQEEVRQKQSAAKRREKNPNWTGASPNLLDVQEAIATGQISSCQRCGTDGVRLLAHHRDGNHDNDDRDNIVVWCHRCHNRHHERGYNFWNGKRRDGKQLVSQHNGQTVQSVVHMTGTMPVINVSCAPHNTYLANRMWVHNCDTDYTSSRYTININALLDDIQKMAADRTKQIVLTGGEPLRQDVIPLCMAARARWFDVQIETNGTLWQSGLVRNGVTIVCSPKTPNLDPTMARLANYFKYVLDADHVDPTDGLPTNTLGMSGRPGRPAERGIPIYVQPMDSQDPETNKRNLAAAVDSCLKFGYRLSIQTHKIAGVP